MRGETLRTPGVARPTASPAFALVNDGSRARPRCLRALEPIGGQLGHQRAERDPSRAKKIFAEIHRRHRALAEMTLDAVAAGESQDEAGENKGAAEAVSLSGASHIRTLQWAIEELIRRSAQLNLGPHAHQAL